MKATILFNTDGTAECLHTDLISLQALGRLRVRRASEVEFNEHWQRWQVWKRMGGDHCHRLMFSSESRQECLDWERDHWEELI